MVGSRGEHSHAPDSGRCRDGFTGGTRRSAGRMRAHEARDAREAR